MKDMKKLQETVTIPKDIMARTEALKEIQKAKDKDALRMGAPGRKNIRMGVGGIDISSKKSATRINTPRKKTGRKKSIVAFGTHVKPKE